MTPGRSPLGLASRDAPPPDLPFRFFLTALVALAALAALAPWQASLAQGSFADLRLVVLVHLNTLGIIGATILGASYQLLPVVLQTPLASVRLGWLSWWLYVPGLLAFAAGLARGWTPLLGLGGTLLVAAVWLYAGVAAATLARSTQRDVVFWYIAVAVAGLVAGAGVGLLLAFAAPGGWLGGLAFRILAAHVVLMLGGWVTPMLTGVAYRLVGMFTLSEDRLYLPVARAELLLTAGGAWLLAAALLLGLGQGPCLVGSGALLAGLGLFAAQLGRLYRLRRRRTFDIHMPFMATAVAFGLLAAALVGGGLVTRQPVTAAVWRAAGWLAIAGWAETAIQGFLYKIGPFLTWLRRYAPLAGRRRVPRLEELYGRRVALAGWAAWSLGVTGGAVAILSDDPLLAHVAGAALSLGLAALLVNAVRVGRHWRATAAHPSVTTGRPERPALATYPR